MRKRFSLLHLLVVLLIPALFLGGEPAPKKPVRPPKRRAVVFVCTGPYASTYHTRIDCPALKQCRHEVRVISLQRARIYRTPCMVCGR